MPHELKSKNAKAHIYKKKKKKKRKKKRKEKKKKPKHTFWTKNSIPYGRKFLHQSCAYQNIYPNHWTTYTNNIYIYTQTESTTQSSGKIYAPKLLSIKKKKKIPELCAPKATWKGSIQFS
jgi:hypothetical protein